MVALCTFISAVLILFAPQGWISQENTPTRARIFAENLSVQVTDHQKGSLQKHPRKGLHQDQLLPLVPCQPQRDVMSQESKIFGK